MELEHRLRNRGTESDEAVRGRLEAARREIEKARNYDYVVVNDKVEEAAEQIRGILNAEKCRAVRNGQLMERMLGK